MLEEDEERALELLRGDEHETEETPRGERSDDDVNILASWLRQINFEGDSTKVRSLSFCSFSLPSSSLH